MLICLSCGVLFSSAAHLGQLFSLSFIFHPTDFNVLHMSFNTSFDKDLFKYIHGLSSLGLLE